MKDQRIQNEIKKRKIAKRRFGTCLQSAVESRIVGGSVVSPQYKYPWFCSLIPINNDFFFCGGALISSDTVLTAAHCVVGDTSGTIRVKVRTSRANSNGNLLDGTIFNVSSISVHPNYNDSTSENDIAVLKLATPVPTTLVNQYLEVDANYSGDLNFLDVNANIGTLVQCIGFGATSEGGPTATSIQEIEVPIISFADANDANSYQGQVTPDMIVAGKPNVDSCQGDSGGPLFINAGTSGSPLK